MPTNTMPTTTIPVFPARPVAILAPAVEVVYILDAPVETIIVMGVRMTRKPAPVARHW